MADDVSRYACGCCKADGDCPPPSLEEDPCGYALSKADFEESVRDEIPDSAESMRWLRKRLKHVENGTDHQAVQDTCTNSDDSETAYESLDDIYTYSGVIAELVKDPEDDCSEVLEVAGSGTDLTIHTASPCADPPETADPTRTANLTVGPKVEGSLTPWAFWDEVDPLDSDYSIALFSTMPGSSGAGTATIDISGTQVLQSVSRSWDYVSGRRKHGNETVKNGYSVPFFRNKLTVPDAPEVKFMEVEWRMKLVPDEGEPTVLPVRTHEWVVGEPREFLQVETYPGFGVITLDYLKYRCNPDGFWIDAE